jgi:Holliday junction DNA helicase RuvA
MYSFIEGEIIEKSETRLVIKPDGVGFGLHINIPSRTFHEIPSTGGNTRLYTSFQVKEDSHSLYGFQTPSERDLFEALLKISGVGGKTAVAILDLPRDRIVAAIAAGDSAVLQKIQGVGAKTAGRIVLELKDRFASELMEELAGAASGGSRDLGEFYPEVSGRNFAEAVEALTELGYQRDEARRQVRVSRSELGEDALPEDIVRHALKSTG